MSNVQAAMAGRVAAVWRYPVKSMRGEEVEAADVTERGLLGDRGYALIDAETGKAASAKNPRRWPGLFDFAAQYAEPPRDTDRLPPALIVLPSGETLRTDQADIDERLSAMLGRRVSLARSPVEGLTAEGYWPDHDWLRHRDEVFEFELPPGTFFDGATVHLVTTATLECLRSFAPASRFEAPRFRPNLVIDVPDAADGFPEDGWIGRTLEIGGARLRIDRPTPRCVMTTLPQGGLPRDPAILRTAVQQNEGNVGAYATVLHPGRVQRGDRVGLA
jgi:uncharacterized protein YcbX